MTAPLWHKTADRLPPAGVIVMTKIDDDQGLRNEQELVHALGRWWFPDRTMYVYWRPTHWREVAQ